MIPILYDKDGNEIIGQLADTVSAAVLERTNGEYTATFTYPYVSDYYSQIDYDSIVMMLPNQKSNLQKFRVSSISKPINGIVTYGCEHISYELGSNPIFVDAQVDNKSELTPSFIFYYILSSTAVPTNYFGTSDITAKKKCALNLLSAREAIMKTQQYFGGELEWDNNVVILHKNRGVDNGAVIEYGNNLLDYTQKTDTSSVYTAIAPYMQMTNDSGETIIYTLPEKYLEYFTAYDYSYVRAKAIDLTSEFTEEEFEELTSESDIINALRNKASGYLFNSKGSDFSCNITLSYVDLRKAKEFETIETMNDLGLCDYVTIKDDRLGVHFKAQVISTKFNVLTEMYDSIEIGTPTEQLLDTLASITNDTTAGDEIKEIKKNIDEYFSQIKITDRHIIFTSGNIMNVDGKYNEYKYKIERDTDIQEEGVLGKIISFTDPQNHKTKIVREEEK